MSRTWSGVRSTANASAIPGTAYTDSVRGTGRTVITLAVLRSVGEFSGFVPPGYPAVLKPAHSSGPLLIANDHAQYLRALATVEERLVHDDFEQTLEDNYAPAWSRR